MFTGLITHRARINDAVVGQDGGLILTLDNPFAHSEPVVDGESIAVNGCCLTALVADSGDASVLRFFVSSETMSLTTVSKIRAGDSVNLERAMRLGERFGGHIVSGHVDCMGEIVSVKPESGSSCVTISYPSKNAAVVIAKGSIAIDGVSLTINELMDEQINGCRRFMVNIIPHTNEHTGFAVLNEGDKVNLEFDMLAKFASRSSSLQEGSGLFGEDIHKDLHKDVQKGASIPVRDDVREVANVEEG